MAQDILNAVINGDMEKVKSLLKQNPELIHTKDQYKNSLLYRALLKNDFSMARFLIENGIDVNYGREDTGGNALWGSIIVGSLEITKLILEYGADINIKNTWGATPLDAAIYEGHKDIAYFLMDKGAILNIEGRGVSSLLRASLSGGMERITNQLIKEHDVDFTNTNSLGDTFLHAAAQGRETAFIDILIKKGLNPNTKNIYGWAPLHYAASEGYQKIVNALINNKADKNIRTNDGKTPFNIAEELGQKELLSFLKEKDFDTGAPRFPRLDAKYIDPNLPGTKPQRFAVGIVSQIHHFEHCMFSFTSDMDTACWADWNRNGVSKIFVMEKKNGYWQPPQTVQLHATNPFITSDGKKIYFTAKRPLPDGKEARDNDIFYIQRTESGWSERISLGPSVNAENDEGQPTVTKDGTVYFVHNADIYRSKLVNGQYSPKERLPAPINTESSQSNPFISADESFMIYCSLGAGGIFEPNFYFLFRNKDDSWTEPVNIAKKVENIGLFASITPDRKYMIYFLGGDYFWFDISTVMEELMKSSL
jgi:ankyrin repeat protein